MRRDGGHGRPRLGLALGGSRFARQLTRAPELETVKQLVTVTERGGRVGHRDLHLRRLAAHRRRPSVAQRVRDQVRVVLDRTQDKGRTWSATHLRKQLNIEPFLPRRDWGARRLHHKLMVIDEAIVVAGSFNYTEPANEFNDENIFVVEPLPPRSRASRWTRASELASRATSAWRSSASSTRASASPRRPGHLNR